MATIGDNGCQKCRRQGVRLEVTRGIQAIRFLEDVLGN